MKKNETHTMTQTELTDIQPLPTAEMVQIKGGGGGRCGHSGPVGTDKRKRPTGG